MVPGIQLRVFKISSDGRAQTPLKNVGIHVPKHSGIELGVVVIVGWWSMQQVPPFEQDLFVSISSQSKLKSWLTQVPSHKLASVAIEFNAVSFLSKISFVWLVLFLVNTGDKVIEILSFKDVDCNGDENETFNEFFSDCKQHSSSVCSQTPLLIMLLQ